MVRLEPDSSGAEAPLILSLFAEGSEEPLVVLQVNEPRMWLLDTVTVLRKPPGCNAGKHFTNVSQALGVLQEWLPSNRRGRMAYLRHMHAYIVGEFDDTKVEAIQFVGEGGSTLRLEHSPTQATVRVRCHSRACGADGHEGRWVPVGALRPFAPPNLSDVQTQRAVVSMMNEDKHVPKTRRHRGAEEGELHATKRRADAPLDCGQSSKPRVGAGGEPPEAPAQPPKERQRHDKPGNVVFCRDELPHRPLVSEGSRNGAQSKSHLGTQKTVFARPLLGESAPVESHPLSRLESLKERLPAMYDEWCRTRSESVCRLIARCVKKQHERARGMQTPQQTCEHLMPGQWGQWLHALAFE